MKKSTKFAAAGATVALLALVVWAFAPRPLEVEVAQVTQGPFETTIDEDARTRLRDRFVVSAPLAGRLERITWREGDRVEAGAVLATLVPVLAPMLDERTLREQRARVAATEAALQRSGTRIGAGQVALEQARSELRRTEQLAQQGFVAPTKVEGDRLAVQAAQKELETAVEGQHVATHELQQAREALSMVRSPSGSGAGFVLRAPVAGRVLRVHQASETTVALGTPLVDLGDTTRLEVVAELLTTDALQVAPGAAVRLERWGGPATLQARVRAVEPAAFTKVSALGVEEQRVNVLIDLSSPAAEWAALGDGYRVGVRIVTRSEAAVPQVPVSALFPLPGTSPAEQPRHAVFVLDGGHARLRPVNVAARNGSQAWVREGLAAGTSVIVYPPAGVKDGARVSARSVRAP